MDRPFSFNPRGNMIRTHASRLAGLALLLAAVSVHADTTKVLDKTTTGTPAIEKIDVIRFGPGGVLFIGDGTAGQVVAVAVDGNDAKAGFKDSIERIDTKLAAGVGAPAKGVEVVDLAVHPVSKIAYVAVRK